MAIQGTPVQVSHVSHYLKYSARVEVFRWRRFDKRSSVCLHSVITQEVTNVSEETAASVFRIRTEEGGSLFIREFGDHAPGWGGVVTREIAM
jgi:hypothetical protein